MLVNMRAPTLHRYTWRQYLELEEESNVKHEFLDGEIFAMAGGTPEHAALAANFIGVLHSRLAGTDCRVFTSDLRVRTQRTGFGTYPDVTVICGEIRRDAEDLNTAVNPRVVVEVLSESTEAFDRGQKLEHFMGVASLQEIVLVSHRERLIEVYRRQNDGEWRRVEARAGSIVRLESIACDVSVDSVYAGVSPV